MRIVLLSFLLTVSSLLFAQVRLPRLVGDSMVLQRDVQTHIWGWAAAGEDVRVSFINQQYKTKAGSDGKWSISLKPAPAGGPYTMNIDASNNIILRDIMMGEVWLCSGQSNMEQPIDRVKEYYPFVL